MKEFEEIAHSSFRIEFSKDGAKLSGESSGKTIIFFVCISFQGEIIGRGFPNQIYPKPSFLVPLVSDIEGMYGMLCQHCERYFRSTITQKTCLYCSNTSPIATCPYCEFSCQQLAFLTSNQIEFLEIFIVEEGNYKDSGAENFTIDLDEIRSKLKSNKSKWIYTEERQQRLFNCQNCSARYDVLGDYACCPNCRKRNHLTVISQKIEDLKKSFEHIKLTISDRNQRENEWKDKLSRMVSDFESLANDLRKRISNYPLIPKRKLVLCYVNFWKLILHNDELISLWLDQS